MANGPRKAPPHRLAEEEIGDILIAESKDDLSFATRFCKAFSRGHLERSGYTSFPSLMSYAEFQ